MNYIRQLNAAMIRIAEDDRLNPTHVSLYLALFQLWNLNRFRNPISINREEVMRISKIGSRRTYLKCVRDLHRWEYLEYMPSHNPYKGSRINMCSFDTSSTPSSRQVRHQPVSQEVSPSLNSINNTKQSKRVKAPTLDEVKDYLKNDLEAEKFFNYYTANGWKIGGKTPMKDWKAAARNWILKAEEIANQTLSAGAQQRGKGHEQKMNNSNEAKHLHTNPNKDYHEPL